MDYLGMYVLFTKISMNVWPGNTKGGSITVLLTSSLTGLDWSVLQSKTKIVSCHTVDSKPVKQEVNSTVIIPPLVFPGLTRVGCTIVHIMLIFQIRFLGLRHTHRNFETKVSVGNFVDMVPARPYLKNQTLQANFSSS